MTTIPTALTLEWQAHRSFTSSDVCAITGITYRQLDYWTRTGLIDATGHPTTGHGDPRWYRDTDVLAAAVVAELIRAGMALAAVRDSLARIITDGHMTTGHVTVTVDVAGIREGIEQYRRAAS